MSGRAWQRPELAASFAERRRSGADQHADLDTGEDRPDTLEEQMQWLRDAGFTQVQVHFKWAEAAVFGGSAPAKGDHR